MLPVLINKSGLGIFFVYRLRSIFVLFILIFFFITFLIELISSIKKIKQKKIKLNEKNIDKNLYTKDLPDPDILIRTGNTQRLSNFLLWQLAYTEIFFEKKLWPDFNAQDFKKILSNFKKIKRNFGAI